MTVYNNSTSAEHTNSADQNPPPKPARSIAGAEQLDALPVEMRDAARWLVWRFEYRGTNWTKVPYCASAPSQRASSTDPHTWTDYATALAVYLADESLDGIGFVFGDDNGRHYGGIDLDHCIDGAEQLSPEAQQIIELARSYTEKSPSATGVHILLSCSAPLQGRRHGGVEMYGAGRFFTVTGRQVPGTAHALSNGHDALNHLLTTVFAPEAQANRRPAAVARPDRPARRSDEEIIARARTAENGEEFGRLWQGDHCDYSSQSEADLALCSYLAFWSGRDADQIDRLFRQSGLYREKWDRNDYRERTIGLAIDSCAETYCQSGGGRRRKKISESDTIVLLAEDVELWHEENKAYGTITVENHRENHLISSPEFRQFLSVIYYRACRKSPKAQSVQEALDALAARAIYDGPAHVTSIRIAEHDGAIYLDLCDSEWRAVKIDATGYRLASTVPVWFIRRGGMQALPVPAPDGNILDLRPLVNADNAVTWILGIAFLVMIFHPRGPYPVLVINGEQGSAKTTFCRMLRRLIDPNDADLRALPGKEQDLMIAATNSRVLAFDNLSTITPAMSDSLCRLATGGGFATRELYSDDRERIFSAARPIIFNGIEELATRPDLLERAIVLNLPRIDQHHRQSQESLMRRFEMARPRILGGLLAAVSTVSRNISAMHTGALPRMADFAIWIMRAEPAFPWPPGAFLAAYRANQDEIVDAVLETSAIGPLILEMRQLRAQGRWRGTATELLTELRCQATDPIQRRQDWPQTPRGLTNALRRIAPALRERGIAVEFCERTARARNIVLVRARVRRLAPRQPPPAVSPHSLPPTQ